MKRQHLIVSGHVQGVGFRYHVQKYAKAQKLTGSVRNLDSGKVAIEVQGEAENIDAFLEDLKHRIPYAEVADVEVEEASPVEGEHRFTIKY